MGGGRVGDLAEVLGQLDGLAGVREGAGVVADGQPHEGVHGERRDQQPGEAVAPELVEAPSEACSMAVGRSGLKTIACQTVSVCGSVTGRAAARSRASASAGAATAWSPVSDAAQPVANRLSMRW